MEKKIKNKNKIHVRIGEKVKVISGSYKGKIGFIKTIIKQNNKIIVEGINIRIKHIKASRPGQTGEIKRMEFPIHNSNVLPYKE
uniref:50S ribosomal protein L24 n=1 Tax=Microzonia abyssicola TaxID=217214 RepID=UPI002E7864CE|nr:50S ribosomal protein L24 [Syringoderma abyssicola]WAM64975.1 50S ribosomal protein L24 [Syringoderma abyssicola]